MAITSYSQILVGGLTIVTVTSDLTPPPVYLHWYVDGAFIVQTTETSQSFFIPPGDQVRIEVVDSLDINFDAIANAPVGFPARRTVRWIRSDASDVAHYRVEQRKGAGAWGSIGTIEPQPSNRWAFGLLSPRLDDLAVYEWRVVPVDAAGNDGMIVTIADTETIARTPDSPDFTVSFDPATTRVTFAAA